MLFTFNLSSDTVGDSGTGGDTDLAAGSKIAIFVQKYVDKLLRRRRWKFCYFGSGDEVFFLPRGCELAGRPIVDSSHVQ
jgi:hypothetical protein